MQTTLNLHMWYIIYIIKLFEILVQISVHKHLLIIITKFCSPMISNVHTMSLADMSATLQKSYGWQHSF